MISFLRLSFFVVTLTVVFISCNQDPTSVGSNLISEQDKFTFQQLNSDQSNINQSSSYYDFKPKLGTAEYLLLGKTPYAESSIMFRFNIYIPDSTLTRFNNGEVNIKEAWMKMIPRYTLGDKSSNFDFSVHQVRSAWSAPGFNRDSIPKLTYDAADVKSGLVVTDTTVKFNLNTNVIKEWFRVKKDNTAPKNNGIILKPGSVSKMLGFLAVQPNAKYYETYIYLILERPNYYKDTLVVSPDEDVHFVTGTLPQVSNNLYLEGGYSIRGSLFFDISSLPKNSIINKAIIELTADPSKELDGSNKSDSVLVQLLADSTAKKLADSVNFALLSRTGNLFSGDVTWALQRVLNGSSYQGFLLSLWDEYSSAARIAFYGSKDSNKALRPKLKITYMQKK